MPEPVPPPVSSVYQLRVVLRGISPLVWRRLLVPSEATLADLHGVLQAAFCWEGFHLHRFTVHGHIYEGLYYYSRVELGSLGLRVTERFTYDYDFSDFWCHDIRLEQILPAVPGQPCPRCTGGRRAGPSEDSGGPWAFLKRTYRHWAVPKDAIVDEIAQDPATAGDYYEDLAELRPWLMTEHFDRKALNRALAGLSTKGRAA